MQLIICSFMSTNKGPAQPKELYLDNHDDSTQENAASAFRVILVVGDLVASVDLYWGPVMQTPCPRVRVSSSVNL